MTHYLLCSICGWYIQLYGLFTWEQSGLEPCEREGCPETENHKADPDLDTIFACADCCAS